MDGFIIRRREGGLMKKPVLRAMLSTTLNRTALNTGTSATYPLFEVPDLFSDVQRWAKFADQHFLHRRILVCVACGQRDAEVHDPGRMASVGIGSKMVQNLTNGSIASEGWHPEAIT